MDRNEFLLKRTLPELYLGFEKAVDIELDLERKLSAVKEVKAEILVAIEMKNQLKDK